MYEFNISAKDLDEIDDERFLKLIKQYKWVKEIENKKNK